MITVEEYRQRARDWLASNAKRRAARPADEEPVAEPRRASRAEEVEAAKRFQAALYDAGFVAITWPTEVGGQGLTPQHQQAWNEEAAQYELPTGIYTIGLGMVIPTILEYGTDEQRQRYIPKALRGEEIWSQLFSEPGAGSDVASLQMRATRDGDEWVLSGQKVWTTGAQHSDFGAVIARTDPDQPKHRGITMFIMDFHAPGVTVKPLRQMNGSAEFNEVFLDEVRVPHANVIGAVNEGWRAAIAMLANERVAIGAGGGGGRRAGGYDHLAKLARERGKAEDGLIRDRLADVYVRERVLGFIGMRIRAAAKAGRQPGPEASVAKLYGGLLSRITSDLGAQIAGASGVAWAEGDRRSQATALSVLSAPAARIAGGTDEIQRNIIGERVLGLPKEPQVDRDLPFAELKVGTQREPV